MSDQETDYALESLKISREAVNGFDDASNRVTQLFIMLIVVLTIVTGIVLAYPNFSDKTTFMFIASTAMIVLAILFWLLDNRYRTYLKVAAAVSRELEKSLKSRQKYPWLSSELDNFRTSEKKSVYDNRLSRGIESIFVKVTNAPYDALYLSVCFGSIVVLSFITYNGGNILDQQNIIWILLLIILSIIFWSMITWNNKFVDDWVRDKYKVKEIKK